MEHGVEPSNVDRTPQEPVNARFDRSLGTTRRNCRGEPFQIHQSLRLASKKPITHPTTAAMATVVQVFSRT